jgi:coniferyl-aldehyde dehydrogenase
LLEFVLAESAALVDALQQDYGIRSPTFSQMADASGLSVQMLETRKHLARWMRPEKRSAGGLGLIGARAWIQWQPLGVIGVIAPWNFPVSLALLPTCQALAAGNRVMLKVSEVTPHTAEVMRRGVASRFDASELAVITGDAEVGAAFSRLAFDHLVFTGATSVGRHILRAAAKNLVPVTLELGGKSPALLADDADFEKSATRIAVGKVINAGQICLAPDYALVPRGREDEFVRHFRDAITRMLPNLRENPDYTAVVNERHRQRVRGLLDDAVARGATAVEINPAQEPLEGSGKIAPTLVLGATPQMKIMQQEIFGPVLPVIPYSDLDEAIAIINAGPRPLGAYYFGGDTPSRRRFLDGTHSGGVTIKDRKSTRLNSSHNPASRMPSSA